MRLKKLPIGIERCSLNHRRREEFPANFFPSKMVILIVSQNFHNINTFS